MGAEAERRDQALAPSRRQLGQGAPDLGHPFPTDLKRRQVRLRKVSIVFGELLGALRNGQPARIVPAPGFLDQTAARVQNFRLADDLVLDLAMYRTEGVHVLDLGLGTEFLLAKRPERHVGIAAKLARLHVTVVDADVLEDRPQPHNVLARLVGGAQVGLGDDLHQRHPRPVEVDERRLSLLDRAFVLQLAGVFFEMNAGNAATPRLAVDIEVEVPVAAERQVVLRDLISLGQVRIEGVLAVELREFRNLAVEREGGADGRLDRFPVDHRERSWESEADRAGVRVGRRHEVVGRAPAEHLALRQHLGMDLEPDDHFEARGHRHQATARINGDWSWRKSAAASNAKATCSIVSSRNPGAMTCRPIGRPSATPHGTEMPQTLPRFAGMVIMSFRYMATGSWVLAPSGNATVGDVAPKSASTFSKARLKSSMIRVRTFCACRR